MSKLDNLYYLYSKNGIWIFLLSIFLVNTSFLDDKNKTDNKIKTIVIDPGHGGKDPGNLGTEKYNLTEKDIVLEISLLLGEKIKNNFTKCSYRNLSGGIVAIHSGWKI